MEIVTRYYFYVNPTFFQHSQLLTRVIKKERGPTIIRFQHPTPPYDFV